MSDKNTFPITEITQFLQDKIATELMAYAPTTPAAQHTEPQKLDSYIFELAQEAGTSLMKRVEEVLAERKRILDNSKPASYFINGGTQ